MTGPGSRHGFEFRRADGVIYRFEPEADGRAWKRTDIDLWCRLDEHGEWAIVDATGSRVGWPLSDPPYSGESPPRGRWVSAKDGRSYEYELVWM